MSAVASSPCGNKHLGTVQHTAGLQSVEGTLCKQTDGETDSTAPHHICLFIRTSHSYVLWHKTLYRREMNCVTVKFSPPSTPPHTHTHAHTPSGKPAVISSCFSCSCGGMRSSVRAPNTHKREELKEKLTLASAAILREGRAR